MRFLHTADWHLGKIVNEYSMIEEQRMMLSQIIELAKQEQVDTIVMAGDLYDRSLPSKEAVNLLNETINKLHENQLTLLAIAGNHDSPIRVQYASDLLRSSNIFLAGDPEIQKVSLGDTDFYLIPYADHLVIKAMLDDPGITNLEKALEAQLNTLKLDPNRQNVAIYHGYVIKGSQSLIESDSERPLSIGTTEFVDYSLFKDFDYVALGHLHAPQKVGSDRINYSGSILKYSKSETKQMKAVKIVDLENHQLSIKEIQLIPPRDMVVIKGSFDELMKSESSDYVYIELTDDNMVIEAMNRLKKRYPYAMGLEYLSLTRSHNDSFMRDQKSDSFNLPELFQSFYEHYQEKPLSLEQQVIINDVIKESEGE